MSAQEVFWFITRENARRIADPWAVEHVDAAWSGDVEAAGDLVCALSNSLRGDVALLMWQGKVARPAFREYLSSAWDHDHQEVIDAAVTSRRLSAMFKYAAFSIPREIPESVVLYRGASGLSEKEAAEGYSWTTSFDVAAWFAMRYASDKRAPIVVGATVQRGDIAFFTDERSELECLLLKRPAGAKVSGDVGGWRDAADRHKDFMRRSDTLLQYGETTTA